MTGVPGNAARLRLARLSAVAASRVDVVTQWRSPLRGGSRESSTASVRAMRLSSAPCTWGVWERTVDRPDLVPPGLMLEAVRGLGYDGIELGPPGYFGDGPQTVARALAPYGLELAGAFAPLRIADADGFRDDLEYLDRTVEILAGTGARGPLVIAADENDVRLAAAGQPDALRETTLVPDELRRAAERVELAARRALDRGVLATFHPHTGTWIESPEEVAAMLDATDP